MHIDSLAFIYVFLPLAITAFYLTPSAHKPKTLAVISWSFYLLVAGKFAIFFFASALLDFALLQAVKKTANKPANVLIIMSIITVKTVLLLGASICYGSKWQQFGLFVYSATLLRYLLDIYRTDAEIEDSFADYTIFTSFFAKAYIGPVVRYNRFMPQIKEIKPSLSSISKGLVMFIKGLGKKVILANGVIGLYLELSATGLEGFNMLAAWVLLLCMAMGIFFSISAYSDMAKGICAVFSIDVPKTTYYPYQAKTLEECISRINMTLYDTVYESIYTRKAGQGSRINLTELLALAVSTITIALWLNCSFKFLLWGIFMFAMVLAERYIFRIVYRYFPSGVRRIFTFIILLISLAPLASSNFTGLELLKATVGIGVGGGISNQIMYLLTTNYLLIGLCFLLSTSSVNMVTSLMSARFPRFSELISAVFNCGLLVVVTAFML